MTSSLPNFATACLIAASVAAMSVASATMRERIRPKFLRSRLQRLLVAPGDGDPRPSATNSFAVARPMPLFPPVMNAVLFASLMASSPVVALLN